MKDLYAALGVDRKASADEIKRAYRKLTREFHPDKNPGDKAAEERFKEISTAYEVLGDEEKRKLYDEFGDISLTQGFDPERARAYKRAQQGFGGPRPGAGGPGAGFPGGFSFDDFGQAQETSFDDLLSRLFGGGRIRVDHFGPGGPRGGGARQRPIRRRGQDIEGEIQVDFMDALLGTTVPLRVESQDGTGKTLDVKVPQGVSDGAKLRLRGQGGPGDPPGDVMLTVRVRPHPFMERDGLNLHMDLPVTALEAYAGGPVDIPTPWGTVVLKLPPGSQGGQTLRLRGKGVHTTKGDGDLLVTLQIKLPAPGDEVLLERLRALQEGENVRKHLGL